MTLLCRLLKQLPTSEHSAEELDNLLAGKLGFLSFTTKGCDTARRGRRAPLPAGERRRPVREDRCAGEPAARCGRPPLLLDADADRVRDVLTQIRIGLEQALSTTGLGGTQPRDGALPSAVVREQLSGVDFLPVSCALLSTFDERLDGLRARKLAELADRIFVADGCMASFTGSDEDFDAYWDAAGDLGLGAGDGADAGRNALVVPTPRDRHEAFVIPSDICFAARACDPRRLGVDVTGAWAVAANALSYDYLWNEIRVKGGAYGCGFRAASVKRRSTPTATRRSIPRLSAWRAQANGSAALGPTRPPFGDLS